MLAASSRLKRARRLTIKRVGSFISSSGFDRAFVGRWNRVTRTSPRMRAGEPVTFTITLNAPPYEVPCPTCNAFALQACHDKPRERPVGVFFAAKGFPPDAKVLPEAHAARHLHWENHPEFRVKGTSDEDNGIVDKVCVCDHSHREHFEVWDEEQTRHECRRSGCSCVNYREHHTVQQLTGGAKGQLPP